MEVHGRVLELKRTPACSANMPACYGWKFEEPRGSRRPPGSVGDVAMSDLEYQRELSPDQLREALSLLDSTAGAKKPQFGDLDPAEEVDPGAHQASASLASQDQLSVDGPAHRTKHLNLIVFWGLGIAAAATLTLLSWGDGTLTPPPRPGIAHEQVPNQPPAPSVKSAFPTLPVDKPPSDQSPDGSKQLNREPELAGSIPAGHTSRDDDRASGKPAADSTSGIPYGAQRTAAATSLGMRQPRWDERASRQPKTLSWQARAVRLAAEKKQFLRRHRQVRTETASGRCFFFVCLPWQTQRVVYEPPRNANY